MKKIVGLLFVFLLASVGSQAQKDNKKERIEKLKSQKVAFLTDHIGLSSDDAQKFWPVYNHFSEKMDALKNSMRENIHYLHENLEKLSVEEKEQAIDKHVNFEVKEAQLEKDFHEKIKKVLSINQVIKYYEAEHEFKKKLLRIIRESKHSSCNEEEETKEKSEYS